MKRLRIIGLVNGGHTRFDNRYVVEYDPAAHMIDGGYDGGLLITSPDKEDAREFKSVQEAVEYWRKTYGMRPDGKPNRPLTAFNVEIC